MAHIVFTSMLVATSKAPSDALPKSLSCYNDLMFFQTFVAQVNSMISSINGIQLKVRGNDAAPMLALACFAVAGVRGLLLGPSSNCTCSPSGAAQHISLIALNPDPYWHKTHRYIVGLLHSGLAREQPVDCDEVHLAEVLAKEFLYKWSSTHQPVPWPKPRSRKAAQPPNIKLDDI
ncbi:hypothetical protein PGTUg99_010998 [Puccinia graminis f. sp. tritici]|uniref:Uncharacterized protein n=1 Tax=Puccinia graminis f. sp. tritici TaxID=56615 RepID=A0A5B0S6P3_PUCGR|nr:hypothetical protein PGTUg99_010998 [Puccinia graminis f. sp. tritici]